ncbi:iron chelate uptake ABC transporter family permease subunit [Paenibacillus sp. FSL R7-0331]|uniref:iron chelate uptake ABC transporter family permease subunit n=1 Tax=Paenibacillus sp. FSL R7-0331 TaxID=1536773 RepID=UPI0004F7907B|nr:iron chelate uptake ABC transporter family permease subunit [Paenibacillus sp. FSL R7-0331]AIQ52491.1 iron ABC transporter permease [Paenibacillus sp. FSL R7-0331]
MSELASRNPLNVKLDASRAPKVRSARAFRTRKEEKQYWILLTALIVFGVISSCGLLLYNNPVPVTSPSFIPVVTRRVVALVSMLIAAICQSLSTVAFQSITNNRIITPSLLGFEAIYSTIHSSTIFFLGATIFVNFSGVDSFLYQVAAMVVMCLILYGWLLSGKYGNLQLLLLVGIIIGTGLRSVSSFMRRLLAPSEFDILQAKLFASVNNADSAYFPVAIPIVIIAAALLLANAKRLNVLALGKDVSTSLGTRHQSSVIYTLVLISILMAISTALVGPLTFYGFLVATLTYQAAQTYDHRYVFPMALAIGFAILTSAYFVMNHIFNAQGVVSIIIEMVGGLTFLILILRKGSL